MHGPMSCATPRKVNRERTLDAEIRVMTRLAIKLLRLTVFGRDPVYETTVG